MMYNEIDINSEMSLKLTVMLLSIALDRANLPLTCSYAPWTFDLVTDYTKTFANMSTDDDIGLLILKYL